jgi:hypothetical protein
MDTDRIPVSRHPATDAAVGPDAVWMNAFSRATVYRIDPDRPERPTSRLLAPPGERAPTFGAAGSPSIAVGAGSVWVTVGPARGDGDEPGS